MSSEIENTKDILISNLMNEIKNQDIDAIKKPSDPNLAKEFCKKVAALRGRPLFLPYMGSGRGNGVYVELEDLSVKMDLVGGIGIHILGHGHPEVTKAALKAATSDIVMQGNLQMNVDWIKLSEKFVKLASKNSNLQHSWLTTSGTMANENALKIIRSKHRPARKIIAMKKAFAGRSTMMNEISDNPEYKKGLPTYDEVLRLEFYNSSISNSCEKTLAKLREHISNNKDNIAAFVFELVQGEGGFRTAPRKFFLPLLEECKANGIAIWDDEVQTFARTGEFFAYEKLDLGKYVDVVTVGKAPQIATTLFTKEYNPRPGLIAGTFAGSTVQMATGLKILEILEHGFMGTNGRINEIYNRFTSNISHLNNTECKGLINDISGMGLMISVTPFDGTKENQIGLIKTFYKNGLVTFGCGRDPYKIRFLPPAIITDNQIDLACEIIKNSVLEYKQKAD